MRFDQREWEFVGKRDAANKNRCATNRTVGAQRKLGFLQQTNGDEKAQGTIPESPIFIGHNWLK